MSKETGHFSDFLLCKATIWLSKLCTKRVCLYVCLFACLFVCLFVYAQYSILNT